MDNSLPATESSLDDGASPCRLCLAHSGYFHHSHCRDFCHTQIRTLVNLSSLPQVGSLELSRNTNLGQSLGIASSSAPAVNISTHSSDVPSSWPSSSCSLRLPPGLWSESVFRSSCEGSTTQRMSSMLQISPPDSRPSSMFRPELSSASDLPQSHPDPTSALDITAIPVRPTRFSLSGLQFLGTLGRGGYGKVLLAESSRIKIAVKVLVKAHMDWENAREVKTEVDILRMLSRSDASGAAFLQKIHTRFQTREHVFIVMEHHCAPLSHSAFQRQLHLRPHAALSRTGPPFAVVTAIPNSFSLPIAFPSCSSLSLQLQEALTALRLLSAELILGLLFLHSQGIVHQDIKPANVLVSANGHAVITDFGSARFMPLSRAHSGQRCEESPNISSNATWTTSPFGSISSQFGPILLSADDQVSFTKRYVAPELLHSPTWMQGKNVLVYDERVDYYSLGVMLREIALGGDLKRQQDRWERASDGNSRKGAMEVNDEFVNFTDELLVHDPDERLHGHLIKHHPFLDPLRELWDDIAALRYPPFTEVIWPAVDGDTRLDLCSFSGEGSTDSLDGQIENWLADIPYDIGYSPTHDICSGSSASLVQRIPKSPPGLEAVMRITSIAQLRPSWTDSDPSSVELLSFLPTFRSLNSPSLEDPLCSNPASSFNLCEDDVDVTKSLRIIAPPAVGYSKHHCHVPSSPPLDSGYRSPSLRRRQVVYDLRKAFQFAYTVEHPSQPSLAKIRANVQPRPFRAIAKPGPGADCKKRTRPVPGSTVATGERMASSWSFEHEITIALLATMGNSRNSSQVRKNDVGTGGQRAQSARKMSQSILRKLKGLVS